MDFMFVVDKGELFIFIEFLKGFSLEFNDYYVFMIEKKVLDILEIKILIIILILDLNNSKVSIVIELEF